MTGMPLITLREGRLIYTAKLRIETNSEMDRETIIWPLEDISGIRYP